MKRVLILGIDGYLGWSLATYLKFNKKDQYVVGGVDNGLRRKMVASAGSISFTDILSMQERANAIGCFFAEGDITDREFVSRIFATFRPDAIVHLAEQPSAPWSMLEEQCIDTYDNNLKGTLRVIFAMAKHCPDAHLIKLGSMGEYGQPNVDIPEGKFEFEINGRKDVGIFPRRAGSFYHLTKVHDTHIIEFWCRESKLKSTDIMQGVVYGLNGQYGDLATRFDADQYFGTVINRFVAQAVLGEPITVYGEGEQKRSFLPLEDSMQCLQIAIDNPPKEPGEYRTFNQFDSVHSIWELAQLVRDIGEKFGKTPEIKFLENPRSEIQDHHYNPVNENLKKLGYIPKGDMEDVIVDLYQTLRRSKYRERLKYVLNPDVRWSGEIKECKEGKGEL